jgi:CubicO group peptidase (beta-lactamase class C family)
MTPTPVSRPRPFRSALPVLLALLAPAVVANSVAAQDLGELDEIFSWATATAPGCAVAVSLNGERVVSRAFGAADLERGLPLTPDSVFDVGSVTKQFVAAAVLLLVEDGRLSLAGDVREHIPELPDCGHRITIDHLLTHTSGVRDWTGLARLSSEDEGALTMILRQRRLEFAPGEEWSYSNSGYVLLKELVKRVTGKPFSEVAQERLFEPLGMETTAYVEDVRPGHAKLARAYEKRGGRWVEEVLTGNERGGGGALLSTAGDLLLWNEALTNARLGAFVTAKLQEPATLNNGRKLGYARGLFLDTKLGSPVVWHGGGAGGYETLLARFPEQRLSIAILCNGGDAVEPQSFAPRIYELFVPEREGSDSAAAASDVEPPVVVADVQQRAGLFFSEGCRAPLQLVARDGRLRVAGGPELVPLAENRFRSSEGSLSFRSEELIELRFLAPDELELASLSVAGDPIRYRRARPEVLTAEELEALAGRYGSDEVRAVLVLTPAEGALKISINGSPTVALTPVHRDTFQMARVLLRVRRDEHRAAMGLDYSNPALRHIPFTRLKDDAKGH